MAATRDVSYDSRIAEELDGEYLPTKGIVKGIPGIFDSDDYEDPQPFPNPNFPFFSAGDGINPTMTQNKEWASRVWNSIAYETPEDSFRGRSVNPGRQRTLHQRNKLGMDEKHLNNISDPEKYWKAVIKIAPPRPWIDISKVMNYLTAVRPMEQPSSSKLWSHAKSSLAAAIQQGSDEKWEDGANIRINDTKPEFWEALRIVGDAEDGHGIFPSKLHKEIVRTGFAWIFAKPDERVLPKCWERYASRAGIKFSKSMPVMYQGPQDLPSRTSSFQIVRDEFLQRGPPIMLDEQQKYFQDLYQRAEQGGSAFLEGSQIQQPIPLQDHPMPAVEEASFVDRNTRAAEALRLLRTKDAEDIHVPPRITISRPLHDTNIWATFEQNMARISTHLTETHKLILDQVEKIVFAAVKEAVDDGPIEGKIREILTVTFVNNKDFMASTIEQMVAVSSEKMQNIIGSVQETAAELAEKQQTLQADYDRLAAAHDSATKSIAHRLEALESKIYRPKNIPEHPIVIEDDRVARVKTEPTPQPGPQQDGFQFVNPFAHDQPNDTQHTQQGIQNIHQDDSQPTDQHTSQVIPWKRKNMWAE